MTCSRWCRLFLSLALSAGLSVSAHAQQEGAAHDPGIEELASQRTMFPGSEVAALSADAALVAYALYDPRQSTESKNDPFRSRSNVHVTQVRGDGTDKRTSVSIGSGLRPAWAPDNRTLAFLSLRDGALRLWLWDRDSGKVRRLSDAVVRDSDHQLRWTSDGRHVLTVLAPEGEDSQRNQSILAQYRTSGGDNEMVPGSTLVLFRSEPQTPSASAGADTVQPTTIASARELVLTRGDLALVDVTSGTVRRLARNISAYWPSVAFSPDGGRLAYVELAPGRQISDVRQRLTGNLVVADLKGDTPPRVVAKGLWGAFVVSWSPDGKSLAYAGKTAIDEKDYATGDLYIISADGGPIRRLSGAPSNAIVSNKYFLPLWNASSNKVVAVGKDDTLWMGDVAAGTLQRVSLSRQVPGLRLIRASDERTYWSADRGVSLFAQFDNHQSMTEGFVRINLQTGRADVVLEEFQDIVIEGDSGPPRVSADGRMVVYLGESAGQGPNLWVADVDFKASRRVTEFNPQFDRHTFSTSQLIEYRSVDGTPLRGALLLPADYRPGQRYPLVLWIYPGKSYGAANLNKFGLVFGPQFNLHMLTMRGYAVLFPDMPVNTGTIMRDIMKSAMPAVDRVVELGIADPDRMAVMGHSQGGYATLALIVQTTRFKAAVMNAGFSDLIGLYTLMDKAGNAHWDHLESSITRIGGTLWERPQRYIENSPIFYLDRVTTPLIIQCGGNDIAAVHGSGQAFTGLKRLKKDVTLLRYDGEGHGLASFQNLIDYWNRVLPFLDKHVKDQPTLGTQSVKANK